MISDEEFLDNGIKAARERLADLEDAVHRRLLGEKCASIEQHYTRCVQSVGTFGDFHKKLLGEGFAGGYQLHRCLVCSAWIVKNYAGKNAAVIRQQIADKLS